MARIRSYARDTNITNQDRILGSSYEGILNNQPIYKTKNYKLTDLAAYFSQNFDFEGVNYDLAAINDYWTNLANSIGNVNEDGSLASISIQFANDLIALVENGAFPEDLASYILSIATLNEAFANQVLDLATSTAYATEASFNSLSAFVDQIDTNVQGLQVDVTNVVAATNTNTGAITANATAITALGVRTTTAEANVTALQTDFTSLETVVNTNTGNISTNATSISTLGTVVDTATTDIATLKTDVTILESSIDTLSGEVTANASDISLLTTNVNTITADVTAVQTDVTTLTTDVNTNTGDIATQATQVSLLTNRVTTAESNILNTATDLTTLTTTVNGNTGDISTNALSISALTTTVTNNYNTLSANIITVDNARISGDSALTSSITSLTSTVNGNTSSITTNANAISTVDGKLSASYGITVDAGGRVAGLKLLADGTTGSEFIARANTFAVDMPNGTRVLTVNSSGLTIVGSGTFSGNLSAAGGTFAGNLSAAGGTFSGDISGASGTFTGGVSGTGYSLNNSGLSLTNSSSSINIGGGVIINSSGISGIGFSLTSSGLSLSSGPTATAISNAQSTADGAASTASSAASAASAATTTANAAQTAADSAKGVTDSLTSVVTVTNTKLYQGPGTWGGSTTGFYLDNNGFFSLKDKLTFNATSNTLTVNGSGTFTGTLDAGLVNISGNIIRVGVASNYGTFGKLNFVHPDNITSVGKVQGYYYTSGGLPSGGGIFMEAASGASIGLGTNFSGSQAWEIESSFSSIQGTPSDIIFYNSSSNYRFLSTVTGTGTTAIFDISGNLKRASSSRRYKNNILDYDKGLDIIKQIRPVYYNYINEYNIQNAGFIAEEIEELGLKEFVRYDKQLRPDAVDYGQMVALLTKGMQEQQQQIDALKAEIELLKAQ